MPGKSEKDAVIRLEKFAMDHEPYARLLPRNDPTLLERILDSYEREELQRLNDELQERKRLLEERLTELNVRLKELEDLKNRLEFERRQLAAYCESMENHVVRLEAELRLAIAEADRLQLTSSTSDDSGEASLDESDSDGQESL